MIFRGLKKCQGKSTEESGTLQADNESGRCNFMQSSDVSDHLKFTIRPKHITIFSEIFASEQNKINSLDQCELNGARLMVHAGNCQQILAVSRSFAVFRLLLGNSRVWGAQFFFWQFFAFACVRTTKRIPESTSYRIQDFLAVGKRKRKTVSGILNSSASVARCYGWCMSNMMIMKANAKRNLGEFICLSTTKAKVGIIERGGTASLCSRTCVKRNAVGARLKGLSLYFLFIKTGI